MAKQSEGNPVPVLLTRPLAQAQEFAAALTDRFGPEVCPLIVPLMAPEVLTPPLPRGPFAGVIFTSATGVLAAGAWPDLPRRAWCVGDRTAAEARKSGFDARSAGGDAAALVAAIRADPPQGRLLHLRGEDARGDIAATLTADGIATDEVIVYRQVPQPVTAAALALLQGDGPVILPLFSPRSATLFVQAAGVVRAPLHLVAISREVPATELPHASLTVAGQPDGPGMLDAVGRALVLARLP
jgi:uroporphyrinogen-III synthase